MSDSSGTNRKNRFRPEESVETDSEGTWAISYGDMITLLLTFFILFFSIDTDKERSRRLSEALLTALKPLTETKLENGPGAGLGTLGGNPKISAKGTDEELLLKLGARVDRDGARLLVRFPGISFFRSASTRLTSEGEAELEKFTRFFMPFAGNYKLVIRAFSDERQVRQLPSRKFEDNLELSVLRSVAAMRRLQKAGIPLSRIRVGGYGEMKINGEELTRLPAGASEGDRRNAELSLARTIMLIIEPEAKE